VSSKAFFARALRVRDLYCGAFTNLPLPTYITHGEGNLPYMFEVELDRALIIEVLQGQV
jgi:hypothetical protein